MSLRNSPGYKIELIKRVGVSAVLIFMILSFSPLNCSAVEVSTVNALKNAVQSANGGGDKEIVIVPGVYKLNGVYLRITADGVTVRGKTGKREDVILDGEYVTTEIFQVLGSNITLKDLTLKRAVYHPVHIYPDNKNVIGSLIKNVHIVDPGQQAIKINQNSAKTHSVNYGTIEKSRIELTESGRNKVWQINGSCYTGGVDAHHAGNWVVADNVISGFWCYDGLSEHGVHFWSNSSNTIVERNTIINCDRGIGFGLGSSGHQNGIIRNNMIFHDSGHAYSDVGIGLENAKGAQVYNNSIFHQHSYPYAIEYRFTGTQGGFIRNNLTNKAIVSRNGGTASLSHNITSAKLDWFSDAASGNLHLAGNIKGVVDSGVLLSGLDSDFDKQPRPHGSGIDIGADELAPTIGTAGDSLAWLLLLLAK